MADDDQDIRPALDTFQSMIDISANRLVGLRTQCSTSVELTQREIRTLEGKLIKLFSRQLVIKSKLKDRFHSSKLKNIPCLEQWLQVVGLCSDCIQYICSKVKTLEALQEKPHCKIKNFLCNCSQHDEEFRRLTTALQNLKRYTDILLEGGNDGNTVSDVQLHWDSWDWRYTLRALPQVIENIASVPQDTIHHNGSVTCINHLENVNAFNNNCLLSYSVPPTPTTTALSPPITPIHKSKDRNIEKSPGSISAGNENYRYHRHCTKLLDNGVSPPISKSRSHESPLFNLKPSDSNSSNVLTSENGLVGRNRRGRLSTVPGLEHVSTNSSLYSSPTRSPPYITTPVTTITTVTHDAPRAKSSDSAFIDNNVIINYNTVPVPRSPRTPTPITRGMAHDIAHRFTKHFSFNKPCDYCCKPIIMNTGLKCKECRYRCHRDCESKVPHSCGLPVEFVKEFKRRIKPENYPSANESPTLSRSPASSCHPSPGLLSQIERRVGSDSTPASSSHSSAPSSPALLISNHNTQLQPPATALAVLSQKQQFDFSAEVVTKGGVDSIINSQISTESTVVSDSDKTDSDKTVNREDSQDSQNWDGESVDKVWPRQYSVSMKEWEIPWDELKMGDKLGTGHFGTVYRGNWHGDVAIKVLNMECTADEKMLENFKSEVSTFRKTRHDNLVLFMGACMKPPRLAIVTSMVHGITLYKYIHLRKEKFAMSKITIIAQQISQGMGYLHAKKIVHKDLRTKNIFLEKERIIITDFGLFNVTKLCFTNRMQDGLIIPPGWLCYLAPEIMRNLRIHVRPDDEHLPFSKASDVYAFGTVWYELLCGDWPFSSQNPEAIIWQVGKGMKPSLANLEASRDVKDILMYCWSYQINKRPDFTSLLKTLEKLPKKRLARSPSHPVHLSRSAESMF